MLLILGSAAACGTPAPPTTPTSTVPTSRLTTTVTPPVHNPNYFDPLDVATSFLFDYAGGNRVLACGFMTEEYRDSQAPELCGGSLFLDVLPIVTPVDNCRLPDGSFLFRFTVVPGAGEVELPISGATQHLSVSVVQQNNQYAVPAPPVADDPASACADGKS